MVDRTLGINDGLEPLGPSGSMGRIKGACTDADNERESDNTDGLLSVVGTMGKAHQASRDQL